MVSLIDLHVCNSCKTLIEVNEMHGRMHPSYGLATILLAHDPLSSLTYPRIPHAPHIASNLPMKCWLLGNGQQSTLYNTYNMLYQHISLCVWLYMYLSL